VGRYLPDDVSESYFDSVYNDVECPTCHEKWQEEILKGFGFGSVELECESCDTTFTHEVETYFGD